MLTAEKFEWDVIRVANLENTLREKERVIEKLTDEKKVLEKINREQEKQLNELKEEYKKSSNVSQNLWMNSFDSYFKRYRHIQRKSAIWKWSWERLKKESIKMKRRIRRNMNILWLLRKATASCANRSELTPFIRLQQRETPVWIQR